MWGKRKSFYKIFTDGNETYEHKLCKGCTSTSTCQEGYSQCMPCIDGCSKCNT